MNEDQIWMIGVIVVIAAIVLTSDLRFLKSIAEAHTALAESRVGDAYSGYLELIGEFLVLTFVIGIAARFAKS
jgi:hypothetical protein